MNAKELAGSISRFVGQIKPTNNPSDDAVIKGFPEWFIEDLENSATMLRQQADRIVELEKGEEVAGRFYWESVVDGHVMAVPSEGTPHYNKDDFPLYTTPQTKPLSDEKIPSLLSAQVWRELPIEIKTHLVRAIEERHGIK